MKKYFLIILLILSAACSKKEASDPRDLYSRKEIASFLVDLYILEAKVKNLRVSKDSSKVLFTIFEKKLYEKHEFDDSVYRVSFEYYMEDPKGLTDIYSIVVDSLSLRERLLSNEQLEKDTTSISKK